MIRADVSGCKVRPPQGQWVQQAMRSANTYTYDAENRISQVNGGTVATYSYDGAGLR